MATLKTSPNDQSVEAYLDDIDNEQKRIDSKKIMELMQAVSG